MVARLFRSARGSLNRIIDEPWREHVWNKSRAVRVVKSILGGHARVWDEADGTVSIGYETSTGRVYAGRGADYDSALKAAFFPKDVQAAAKEPEDSTSPVGDTTKEVGGDPAQNGKNSYTPAPVPKE